MAELKWKQVSRLMWRADPYLVTAAERIRDFRFTGEVTYAAYLLTLERGSVVGSQPIGPPASTIEAAQRQAARHAARQKGAA